MLGIIFDILLLGLIRKMPKGNVSPNERGDVFIPFEDRVSRSNNQPAVVEKTEYYPEDFEDYGDF